MKIEKKYRFIKIVARDMGVYTDIALVVDKLSFIDAIEKVRAKFDDLKNLNFPVRNRKLAYLNFEYKFFDNSELKDSFYSQVETIRKTYTLPPHFTSLIKDAILYGKVNGASYRKAYLEEIMINPMTDAFEVPDMKYAIIIHSGTRWKDVRSVFKQFRAKVVANQTDNPDYLYGFGDDLSLTLFKDTKESVKKYSDLYHAVQNGKSPLKITLDELRITDKEYKTLKTEETITGNIRSAIDKRRNVIKQEVSRYKDFVEHWNM